MEIEHDVTSYPPYNKFRPRNFSKGHGNQQQKPNGNVNDIHVPRYTISTSAVR